MGIGPNKAKEREPLLLVARSGSSGYKETPWRLRIAELKLTSRELLSVE
jgi:hypothetical protein